MLFMLSPGTKTEFQWKSSRVPSRSSLLSFAVYAVLTPCLSRQRKDGRAVLCADVCPLQRDEEVVKGRGKASVAEGTEASVPLDCFEGPLHLKYPLGKHIETKR